ncbi:hypothetical protein ACPCG0_13605 [Propionibacteriaceae bacterium Y1923]
MRFGPALRLFAGLLLVVVIPSLILVPLLATENPSPTGQRVTAAVVDLDVAQAVDGTTMALGRSLVSHLVEESGEVRWVQVTEADARRGVQSGRYAAVATVPADFTAKTLAAAAGGPAEPQVRVVSSSMAPAAQPQVNFAVARATSQTVGAAVVDRVYLTFSDANSAFKAASDQAGALAKTAGELDDQGKQVEQQAGEVDTTLGRIGEQTGRLGNGPGLPSLTTTNQTLTNATQQAGTSGALSLEARLAIANAAAEAESSRLAGQASASTIAELDRLAKQLDQQATDQQAGVSGYTTSVAAAAQRQRGIDASLRGMKTQLASLSTQLKDVTSATGQGSNVPKSLRKADQDDDTSLEAALAALQALVNQLETDDSADTAVTLATELKSLADQHDSGMGDLRDRLTDLRQRYARPGVGNQDDLPVKCPYLGDQGGGRDCQAWRAGVVTGLDLSLAELDETSINDKSAELRAKAAQNLTSVTAVRDGRDELLKAARNAVVALQNAIANGTPPAEVIEKVTEIAGEAELLSTTAETLASDSTEQTAALQALDSDSPTVQQLSTAAQSVNETLTQQDAQIAALTATVADLSGKLEGLTGVVATLREQTTDLESTGAGLRATLQQLQAEQQQLQTELDGAKTTIDEQDERLNRLSGSTAEAQAAARALATQVQQLRTTTGQVKQDSQGHVTTLQNSNWPSLDETERQRVTSLLVDQPAPEPDAVDNLGWTALVATIAIWVGGLAGTFITAKLFTGRRGATVIATVATTALVGGAVSAWLVPQTTAAAVPVVAVVLVASLAAAVVAEALRLAIGPGGVWAGLTLLGITVLAFMPTSPTWLDVVREVAVTSPMLDGLRITLSGGGSAGGQVATMLGWTAVAAVVAVLASRRFRPAKD